MLDAEPAKLVRTGTVTISSNGITVQGFRGEGATCRDVAVLAATWAIGELQRELMNKLEKPGGGKIDIE